MSVNWWRRPEHLEKSTDQPQVAEPVIIIKTINKSETFIILAYDIWLPP
jgi:hypothetical protein